MSPKIWVLASLVIVPIAAHAQLNKCTGPDGKVSYQSEPCPVQSKAQTVKPPSDPGSSGGKSDADGGRLDRMRTGCISGAMGNAKTGWEKDPKAGPFPTSEWRASVEPYCTCLIGRLRASTKPDDSDDDVGAAYLRVTGEAIGGGQCKPGGIMGKALGL